jgi:transposase
MIGYNEKIVGSNFSIERDFDWFVPTSFGMRLSALAKLDGPNEPDNFFVASQKNAPAAWWYSGDVEVFRNQKQTEGAPMSYKYHIGVDYHKKYSFMVVKDNRGQVVKSGQVINQKKYVEKFVEPFREKGHAVVEATRNWVVMHDWLEELLDEVVLANPLKVKAIAEAKIKTDKIDASVLSDLLRADLIPEAHVPSAEARQLRTALRERIFFVHIRTKIKNRIHTIFDRYPEETKKLKPQTDLFGKEGRENLGKIKISELDRTIVDRELRLLDDLANYIRQAEQTIKGLTEDNADVKRLLTIPGFGEFIARLVAAEIDGVERFREAKKLHCYAGLVPSTYSSGGKTFNGRLIKQSNKWLRWALVEAVIPAVRCDEELKDEYER